MNVSQAHLLIEILVCEVVLEFISRSAGFVKALNKPRRCRIRGNSATGLMDVWPYSLIPVYPSVTQ